MSLLAAARPARPVYVGLSIGGLFAAQAHLAGQACIGLLLINTLRKPGPRLEWVNRAVLRAALTGGPRPIQECNKTRDGAAGQPDAFKEVNVYAGRRVKSSK